MSLNVKGRHRTVRASRRLSVLTIRLVRLRTVGKELQKPPPPSYRTPRHPERTTNGYGKEIDTPALTGSQYNHQ